MDKTVQVHTSKTKYWSQWKLWGVLKLKKKFTRKLPPEMEEEILERISDTNTLLKCRQVCSHWKQFIDSKLEKKKLSQWTAWDSDLDSYHQLLNPPIWVANRIKNSSGYYCASHVSRPPPLKAETVENPFPLKSVALISCNHRQKTKEYKNICPGLLYKFEETLAQFFSKSGHFLTSLMLHYLWIEHREFAMILTKSQHLKAISLSFTRLYCFQDKIEVDVPPNLTRLQLYGKCKNSNWLLALLSSQLVSLQLVKTNSTLFNTSVTFIRLKQLFIYDVGGIDLSRLCTSSHGLPVLEYFNAIGMELFPFSVEIMENFIYSLSSIATSLIYFRLRISTYLIREVFEKCGVVFPKLRVLEIVMESEEPEIDKLEISKWFPRVESVTCVVDNGWHERFFKNLGDYDCLVCKNEHIKRTSALIFMS